MSFSYFEALPADVKAQLSFSEVEDLIRVFQHFDKAREGVLDKGTAPNDFAREVANKLGERFGNANGFLDALMAHTAPTLPFADLAKVFASEHKRPKKITREVSAGGAIHSFSDEERQGYVEFINSTLKDDPDLQTTLPINPRNQDIFTAVSKGIVLCKLINSGFPNTINEAKLNLRAANPYEKNENHDLCIQAAAKLGCSVVNIGGKDLLEGTPHLALGLMWQIIKKNLLALVAANLSKGEGFIDIPPEQMLFRWFNFHLANADSPRTLSNWSRDLQDSELYLTLLSQLEPEKCPKHEVQAALALSDPLKRAEVVCQFAERIGCLKFITPKEIVNGNPRLNLAFVATLFTQYPQMGPTEEEKQIGKLQERLGSVEQSLAQVSGEKSDLAERAERLARDFEAKSKEASELSGRLAEALQDRDSLARQREQLEASLASERSEKDRLALEVEALSRDKHELSSRLADETAHREKLARDLENARADLREAQERHEQQIAQLSQQLAEQQKLRQETEAQLRATRDELAATIQKAEQVQKELQAQLAAERRRIEELEEEIRRLKAENAELRRQLEEEREARQSAEQELDETRAELEETRAEADEEKTLLLQRIKDLEEELDQLKELMATSLTQAGREKADALRRAQEEKERMLDEAEKARIAQMRKVQGMLAKVQKKGYLYKLEKSAVLGTSKWKKRYFVLQDNFLSYYKDEKAFTESRPDGIVYCEQCRIYELDQGKKNYGFQLDSGKQQYNLAALKLDDMKEWMKDIKEAKKKAVGVKVVSEDKASPDPSSPRMPGSPHNQA